MHKGYMRHLGIIAIVLIMITAACSGEAGGGDRIIKVSMTEFSFIPNVVEIKAGETVKFIITNDGVIDHEFEVVTQHAIDEHIQGGHDGHDGNKGEQGDELELELAAGETGELTVTFDEAQELFFACLIPGHYEAGMVGEFDFGDDANYEEHEDDTDHGDSDEDDHDDSHEEDEGRDH